MGFNFAAFAAGGMKAAADKVASQSAAMDASIQKHMDWGIQNGMEDHKIRTRKEDSLVDVGNQLAQLGLGNDKIKVVLQGGLESAKEFITSSIEAKGADPMFDVAGQVAVTGKGTAATWKEYIKQNIMGTPDTTDTFEYSAPKRSSILGGWLGTNEGSDKLPVSRVKSIAERTGAAMNINVADVLATSRGKFLRNQEMAVQGTVNRGDPTAALTFRVAKQQAAFNAQYNPLQMQQARLAIAHAKSQEERAAAQEKVDALERKYAASIAEWKIKNSPDIKKFKVELQEIEYRSTVVGVPKDYESGILVSNALLHNEVIKGENADPVRVALLEGNIDRLNIQYAALIGVKTSSSRGLSFNSYRTSFADIFEAELTKKFTDPKKRNWMRDANSGLIVWAGTASGEGYQAYHAARQQAVSRFQSAVESLPDSDAKSLALSSLEDVESVAAAEQGGGADLPSSDSPPVVADSGTDKAIQWNLGDPIDSDSFYLITSSTGTVKRVTGAALEKAGFGGTATHEAASGGTGLMSRNNDIPVETLKANRTEAHELYMKLRSQYLYRIGSDGFNSLSKERQDDIVADYKRLKEIGTGSQLKFADSYLADLE